MAQYTDSNTRAFLADAAVGQYILVKLNTDGEVLVAALADQPIGVTTREAFNALDPVDVALLSKAGTVQVTAAGAFDAGAVIYGRADGKVDDVSTSSAVKVGIALAAATADGDVIEMMPIT